jgi:predicted metal-dependent enzyme (double-stranded beta helix superfamily)
MTTDLLRRKKIGYLEAFATRVAHIVRHTSNIQEAVAAIATHLEAHIKQQDFVNAILGEVIDRIATGCLADVTTIFVDRNDLYRIRTMWWPPSFETPVHCHNAWAVTGVLLNVLSFRVYSNGMDQNDGLHVQRHIVGREGEVGRIIPPCFHSVMNPSLLPSVTVSIFGGPGDVRKSSDSGEATLAVHEDENAAYQLEIRSRILQCCITLLARHTNQESYELIDKVFQVGGYQEKLRIIKSTIASNPSLSIERLKKLVQELPEGKGLRVRDLYARLCASV